MTPLVRATQLHAKLGRIAAWSVSGVPKAPLPSRAVSFYRIGQSPRAFWSIRKLGQLESEANSPEFSTSPKKQAEFYRELLRAGKFQAVIRRYEEQPQLSGIPSTLNRMEEKSIIQRDPECLKSYISALAKAGKTEKIGDYVSAVMAGPPTSSGHSARSHGNSGEDNSGWLNRSTSMIDEREHIMRTDMNEWQRVLSKSKSQPALSKAEAGSSVSRDLGEPIRVVLSEAWSWSKFTRTAGTKLLFGLLFITGLSVLLDQQGIIKSGGIGTAEIESSNLVQSIKFADVQGVDEAKQELEEVVAFLREPKKFLELGGKLPKGILLYGPPGTGKTHLARAVAGEAGVPFFQMSGSEFDELYVGVGARRVRELFAAARKKAPCIVFIDEIDAVGSKRSSKDQSYMRQTLNQLLVELDGFSSTEGVIFIAATNTAEALDKALVRPGRFDRHVAVPLPDVKGRSKILQVHMKGVQVSPDVDVTIIARGTPGFSGADLANLINQAALKASKDGSKAVGMGDLEWAKDKILMGTERTSAVITEQSKRLTAYHEGGHALVTLYTNGAMPLHKVTVIPRGNALGLTVQLPEGDKNTHTKRELLAMLDVCMGGRVAEELIFGTDEVTTGASNDLEKATAIAREMVMSYGMSEKVGLPTTKDDDLEKLSPQARLAIETEVRSLLDSAHSRAVHVLRSHKEELHRLARSLMDHETLTLDEVKSVIKGSNIR